MIYRVKDSTNHVMRVFRSYKEASEYKFSCGNYGWTITKG